jgi:hypothetical protein
MAKKTRRSSGGQAVSTESYSQRAPRNFKDIAFELASNPTVRYLAAGVATAILARVANNISDRYPEISDFLKENLDTAEGKLNEFRQNLSGPNARH